MSGGLSETLIKVMGANGWPWKGEKILYLKKNLNRLKRVLFSSSINEVTVW